MRYVVISQPFHSAQQEASWNLKDKVGEIDRFSVNKEQVNEIDYLFSEILLIKLFAFNMCN